MSTLDYLKEFFSNSKWLEETEIINLTDIPLSIRNHGKTVTKFVQPSVDSAYCTIEKDEAINVEDTLVITKKYDGVVNLPEQKPNTIYIVSYPVSKALPERLDLFNADGPVEDGIMYCDSLSRPYF